MTAPNHVAFGITFTGICAAFANVNLFSSISFIVVAAIASLLPDIDHTKSTIGKVVYPFARWFNRKYGHRTLTHSLLALAIVGLIATTIEAQLWENRTYSLIIVLGYLSHIIGDMITVSGVQFFYPFAKNPVVVPGNRAYRFKTGDKVAEIKVFGFVLVLFIFCQPLMKQGFWTSYNRLFGTMKHLASEYKKSDDLLFAKYIIRNGSVESKGSGLVMKADKNKAILWKEDDRMFDIVDAVAMNVREIIPEHTDRKFAIREMNFISISVDSLNDLTFNLPILELEVQANNSFGVHGEIETHFGKRFKKSNLNQVIFVEQEEHMEIENIAYFENPKIATIKNQIALIQSKNTRRTQERLTKIEKLRALEKYMQGLEDLYERDKAFEEVKALRKALEDDTFDESRVGELKAQIKELEKLDRLKYIEKKEKANSDYEKNKMKPTYFTGYMKYAELDTEIKNMDL